MEFIIESKRLIDMFEKALINKQLKKVSANITPEGIDISDLAEKVVGVKCLYRPTFFKDFNNVVPTEFMITEDILVGLDKLRFSNVDLIKVTVSPETGKIIFTGSGGAKNWDTNLVAIEVNPETNLSNTRIGWKLNHTAGVGILPETGVILSQFSLAVDKLTIPDVEQASILTTASGEVIVECEYKGKFTDKLVPTGKSTMGDVKKTVTVEYLKKALASFTGVVWFTFYEQAMLLTQSTQDFELMYSQSVI